VCSTIRSDRSLSSRLFQRWNIWMGRQVDRRVTSLLCNYLCISEKCKCSVFWHTGIIRWIGSSSFMIPFVLGSLGYYQTFFILVPKHDRDSPVGIATGCGLEGWGVWVWVVVGARFFSTLFRLVLGPTQPPIQWLLGRQGWSGWGIKLTTHFSLVPRSRIIDAVHPLPHMSS
jgi:hypothetical protein